MKQPDPALAGRIPPGQTRTTKWPVLTYGLTPPFDPTRWTFRCFGRVAREVVWTWKEFLTLPRATLTSDVHCVTRWSRLDNRWEGVAIRELMARVTVLPDAKYVMVHADPDYTTNLALHATEAAERPARGIEGGRQAVGEDGPLHRTRLARGDPPGESRVGLLHP